MLFVMLRIQGKSISIALDGLRAIIERDEVANPWSNPCARDD